MDKALIILLLAAVIGGGAIVQSTMSSEEATGENISEHEAEVLARQIALSAIDAGISEAKKDMPNAHNIAYNDVPFRDGFYDLNGSLLPGGIVKLHAVGNIDGAQYHICSMVSDGEGGPIESAMIIESASPIVDFRGNSFLISGHDTNPPSMGGLPPFRGGPTAGDALPVHAIGVDNSTIEAYIESEPSTQQEDNITGVEGSLDVYSGPSYFDVDAFYLETLANADTTLPSGNYNGNDVYGSPDDYAVVVIEGDAHITGNWSGYGVLLIEGNLTIGAGDFMWEGIVYVKGADGVNLEVNLSGGVEIYGAIILQTGDPLNADDPDLQIDLAQLGNASVSYSADTIDRLAPDFTTIQMSSPRKAYVLNQRESSTGC